MLLLILAASVPDIRATDLDMETFAIIVDACTSSTAPDYIADLPPKKGAIARLICKSYNQGIKDGQALARGEEIYPRVQAHEKAIMNNIWPPK